MQKQFKKNNGRKKTISLSLFFMLGISFVSLASSVTGDTTSLGSWNSSTDVYVGNTGSGGAYIDDNRQTKFLIVGNQSGSVGKLNIKSGGVLDSTDSSYIADKTGSKGTINVSGSGSIWNNSDYLFVGYNGNATMNITDGGTVKNQNQGQIARESSSTSIVNVNGQNSTWENSNILFVGIYGNGTLNITGGATVKDQQGQIARYASSVSRVNVTGQNSTWENSGNLYVGIYGGHGELYIGNGGKVSSQNSYIGSKTGGFGLVDIDGTRSTFDNAGYMYIGYEGTGSLIIENGGVAESANTFLGYKSSGIGLIGVFDAGSTFLNSGDLTIGDVGSGQLYVEEYGLVDVGGNLILGGNSQTFVNTGGKIHANSLSITSGADLNFELSDSHGNDYMMVVDGELNSDDNNKVTVTSSGKLSKYQRYEVIEAGNITTPFEADITGVNSSIFEFGVESTITNLSLVVTGVIQQSSPVASLAKASLDSKLLTMRHISAHSSVAREIFRGTYDAIDSGKSETDENVAQSDASIESGDWVAYLRQFNDIGGVDDGYDWESSGYLVGAEKIVADELFIGFGIGQSWLDIDFADEEDCSGNSTRT